MFWEGKFTGEEKSTLGAFSSVNIKIVLVAILENTYISNGSEKDVALEISLKFVSLDKVVRYSYSGFPA